MVYFKIIQDTYDAAKTSVESGYGESEDFTVKVDVHQESASGAHICLHW